MPLRNRIFILIGAGIVVIVVIGLAIMFSSKKTKPNDQAVQTGSESGSVYQPSGDVVVAPIVRSTTIPVGVKVKPSTQQEVTETTIRQLAKVFVERYHTYSSENDYQNIRDVESLVTRAYWTKISAPIFAKNPPPASFVAVTTDVIGVVSSDMGSTTGEVVVKARKTSTNNGIVTTSYVDYNVSFVKVGSSWQISGEEMVAN